MMRSHRREPFLDRARERGVVLANGLAGVLERGV